MGTTIESLSGRTYPSPRMAPFHFGHSYGIHSRLGKFTSGWHRWKTYHGRMKSLPIHGRCLSYPLSKGARRLSTARSTRSRSYYLGASGPVLPDMTSYGEGDVLSRTTRVSFIRACHISALRYLEKGIDHSPIRLGRSPVSTAPRVCGTGSRKRCVRSVHLPGIHHLNSVSTLRLATLSHYPRSRNSMRTPTGHPFYPLANPSSKPLSWPHLRRIAHPQRTPSSASISWRHC